MSLMALGPNVIFIPRAEIERFCTRNQIRKLSLFGSILTDRFRPESDVDVLVEFEPGGSPSYFDLVGMEQELVEQAVGAFQFEDMVGGEERGQTFLPIVVTAFDFAFGLGRGSVA